ncbi:MAG TPA: TMEM175 family protein [Solirubrobacteraceae bacterium]
MGAGRLEAFSDGVIAVAITLLVLQIAVPTDLHGHSLAHALLANWSHYAAYVVSFMTIGIIWINHHAMISRLKQVDHSILLLNLIVLMTIAALPFATDLLASYLREPTGRSIAAAVYAGSFLLMGVAFGALNRHILIRREHLLRERVPLAERRQILRLAVGGTIPYLAAVGLAFVSAYLTLAVCAALAVYYAMPAASRRALA